jgi:hypothetical protein
MKRTLLIILTPIMMLLPAAAIMQPVYACGSSTAAQQVGDGVGETNGGACDDSGVDSTVKAVIDILSFVVGVAAVVAMISGGFKYITSGGDAGKVSNAKNTLIYALIGLAIAALAQVLVHFVVNTANNTANACPYTIKDSSGKVITGLNNSDPLCVAPPS